MAVSQHLGNVKVVFAKKADSKILSSDCYNQKVSSFTKGIDYNVKVDKRFLNSDDKVLIIDDFLACGNACLGLIDICNQAGAMVLGCGIVVEKGFQEGRKKIEEKNISVVSCATIEKILYDSIVFKN